MIWVITIVLILALAGCTFVWVGGDDNHVNATKDLGVEQDWKRIAVEEHKVIEEQRDDE